MLAPPASGAAFPAPPQTGARPASLKDASAAIFDAAPILKALDANGDGTLSDQEFAAYRARKQASGEYVPAAGPPAPAPSIEERLVRARIDAILHRT